MKKREFLPRYVIIGVLFVCICLFYMVKLIGIQILNQDYYKTANALVTTERRVTLFAKRGDILDRNGKVLVTNKYTFDICFDAGTFPSDKTEANKFILETIELGKESGAAFAEPTALFSRNEDGEWSYLTDFSSGKGKRLANLLADINLWDEDEEAPEANEAAEALLLRYGILAEDEDDNLVLTVESWSEALLLFNLRLDMTLSDFSELIPYKILSGASVELITKLREGKSGIFVKSEAERVYTYPGLASHILGRVGKIQKEDAEYYTKEGYPLDAIVGTSGAELAFEKYLHGTNGVLVIVEDSMGNVVDRYVEKEAVPGKDVYLTLDVDLQKTAEQALADNIKYIVAKAEAEDETLVGEDADAGAITVTKAGTGEVLAIASNPTYDLSTFNEDYATLREDEKTPLLNRALLGQYTPGSTFKIGVAVAALNENIITPYTVINDTGVYEYYKDAGYSPRCWINLLFGGSHGHLDVTGAIQVSCNYFFYEVGRLLTINTMNDYCRAYGLGQPTGIELSESVGVLAGPDYRAEAGLGAWSPGDTVQAAIGQIENAFTPLQINVYIATILNNGDRIGAHLLKEVREYKSDETVYVREKEVLSHKDIREDVVAVVKNAMKNVTEDNGSAAGLFENYPITIGGKTGTAQVSKTQSDNAVFTAFAPFDSPEIVATCVIEKGAGGTDAGYAVREVFSAYFGVEYKDGFHAAVNQIHEAEAAANE